MFFPGLLKYYSVSAMNVFQDVFACIVTVVSLLILCFAKFSLDKIYVLATVKQYRTRCIYARELFFMNFLFHIHHLYEYGDNMSLLLFIHVIGCAMLHYTSSQQTKES